MGGIHPHCKNPSGSCWSPTHGVCQTQLPRCTELVATGGPLRSGPRRRTTHAPNVGAGTGTTRTHAKDRTGDAYTGKWAEARYRGLLEAAPDAMVVVDQAGDIVLLNLQAEKQFGYRRDALVGQPVTNIIPEGFAARLIADDLRSSADALAQQIGTGIELVGRRADGSEFPIEIMLSPIESAEGIVVTAAIRDISVRKEAEAALEGQAHLLDLARDAIVVRDPSNRITYWSKGAEASYGWTSEEAIGHNTQDLLQTSFPGSQQAVDTALEETGDWQGELGHIARDGRRLTVESRQSVERDANGRVRAILEINRDISIRKTAEEHLAQMEARYRGLLEAAPDAMVVVNPVGEIVLLNLQAEKQFGYQRDELICQPVTNIIPKGFAERLIADDLLSAADATAQQMGAGIELVGLRKDGTEFPIEIMLSPLESTEGMLVTAAIRNISRRKEAEGQLLQAQKLESIGRLAGGIAHDFNNMLFVIHGYAELLTEDLAPVNRVRLRPDDALQSVNEITRAADRAATLTGQLLAFSRQQVIKPRVLSLNAAINDIEPMVRKLIGENMRLIVRLDRDAGSIRGDSGQLDQVLVNLVVNARDAMPDGGTVTIETKNVVVDEPYAVSHFDIRQGLYVLLTVTDTGVGMDRATREHLFEPFFTTKQLGKGTGLGLATTYGIVRQAGGSIWVYSELGLGSSFKLYFPRIDASMSIGHVEIAPAQAAGAGTVLVVEDERAVREMTNLLLTRSGHNVIAVADGGEAMSALERLAGTIQVLITDVIMPAMSGLELAEWTMDRYPNVGVVLLSGYTSGTLDLERVTERGAAFVPKPVTSGHLISAVQQSRALRRANPVPATTP